MKYLVKNRIVFLPNAIQHHDGWKAPLDFRLMDHIRFHVSTPIFDTTCSKINWILKNTMMDHCKKPIR